MVKSALALAQHLRKSKVNTYQLVFIGAFIALLLPKETRFAAVAILAFNAVYFSFIIDKEWTSYYHWSATINTLLGIILYFKYRAVAILSFLLIPINIIGYLLCKNYYDPFIYDNMCFIVILLQILLLTVRGLTDGTSWGDKRNPLVFLANFDSYKNHAKIQKTHQKQSR